jgi:hypothetical protein
MCYINNFYLKTDLDNSKIIPLKSSLFICVIPMLIISFGAPKTVPFGKQHSISL